MAGEEFGVFAGWGVSGALRGWGGSEREYRVKISFVTAAMLYSSRSFRHSASMSAVFPDPTGLYHHILISILPIISAQ